MLFVVSLSLYPHRARLKNMLDDIGKLTLKTRSFHFGITLPRGHPVFDRQKGTPQSIHLKYI